MARRDSVSESLPGLSRVLIYFWPWIRRERSLIATSLLSLMAAVLMRLAEPWPLKFVIDRLVASGTAAGSGAGSPLDTIGTTWLLALCATAVLLVSGLRAFFDYQQRVGMARIGNRVLRRVRTDVYVHVQSLSLAFHNRTRSGDLIVRVTRDVSLLRDVASTAMLPLAASLLIFVGMISIMLVLQWQLALLSLLTLPLFWLSTVRLSRGIRQAARKQRAREGAMAATAAESITAIRDVQALSLQESFTDDFQSRNVASQKEELKAAKLSAKLGRTVDVLLAVATALVLGYGGMRAMNGAMSPGDLLVFLTYLRRAFRPAKDLAKHAGRLSKAAAAGERVMAILERAPEVRDLPGAIAAPRFRGSISFDGVSFGYEPGHPVVQDVSFRIEPGQLVGLTGPSGCGKSTLISLLLRLYDPLSGSVQVDGRDIRDYTVASFRAQFSVVLQDTMLFAGTVRDNIACVLAEATPEQVEQAARDADADSFIRTLPDGYETRVGERGATLSKGQRQRIAIARAALRRSPILLLDEPSTGLDDENARKVAAALSRVCRGATTLLVTHDPRLLEQADLFLHLDGKQLTIHVPSSEQVDRRRTSGGAR